MRRYASRFRVRPSARSASSVSAYWSNGSAPGRSATSAIISALLGSIDGFVLSRWSFRGASLVFTLILFGMFIPYQAVITR